MTEPDIFRELTPVEHAARLARTYELAADLGGIAREIVAMAGRADRAAHRRDIDLLAEASEDIHGLTARYARVYVEMLAVRVRPRPAEPLPQPISDNRMSL